VEKSRLLRRHINYAMLLTPSTSKFSSRSFSGYLR
jgi:hypothetical protein